ncbi:hypothetical protein BXZ70DRAFT_891623 [Cristinia sonorae]|uniref:Uncharacterized protein n=1 Tax=Cristinia sonorae TaxID=1940300 RepID=A0A8K0USH1_9AGAR|nr:hypothetical protein BXZ70DRAFT_891623 [Cristinia sonorae]
MLWTEDLPQWTDRRPSSEFISPRVPYDYDRLLDWCYVGPNLDSRNKFETDMVFLREQRQAGVAEEEDSVVQALFRVQGFVKSVELGLVGNWNGVEAACYRAVQSLTIEGSDQTVPFSVQRRGLLSVRRMAAESVALGTDDVLDLGETELTFHRKVFRKCKQRGRHAHPMKLSHEDSNHENSLRRVQDRWVIADALPVLRMDGNGVTAPTTRMAVKVGDFVDVTIMPTILTSGARTGSVRSFAFSLDRVIVLRPAVRMVMDVPNTATKKASSTGNVHSHCWFLNFIPFSAR